MSVTCPACTTKFRDPPAEIVASRRLQCGHCEHEFALAGDAEGKAEKKRMQIAPPPIVPDISDLVGSGDDSIRTALQVMVDCEHQTAAAAALENKRKEPLFVTALPEPVPAARSPLWSMAALACLTFCCGTILFKDAVMTAVPQSIAYYRTAGLAPAPKLTIANVTTVKSEKDGISRLIVRGEIRNVADATVPVPPIEVTMRDEAATGLYAWTVSSSSETLKPGESGRFTAISQDVPEGTSDVEVDFKRTF